MRDIEGAIFAQLVYNNYYVLEEDDFEVEVRKMLEGHWPKIKPKYFEKEVENNQKKKEDVKIVNGEKKVVKLYSPKDSRIFSSFSKMEEITEENMYFKEELKGWKLLLSKDHPQVYSEMKKEKVCSIIETHSGFQGSCFYNEEKKEAIIAYRGSDTPITKAFVDANIKGDWIKTNITLKLHGHTDQLCCVAWFYDKCKVLLEEKGIKKIGITGHSLGGALAQFAFVYSGCIHQTITWNGLGIGNRYKRFKFQMGNSNFTLDEALLEAGAIRKVIYDKNKNTVDIDEMNEEEIDDLLKGKGIKESNSFYEILDLSSSTMKKVIENENRLRNMEYEKYGRFLPELKSQREIIYIRERLRILKEFQDNYEKVDKKIGSCINFYSTYDMTAHLQIGVGLNKCLETGEKKVEVERSVKEGRKAFNKKKTVSAFHGIFDIFAYLDEKKEIKIGEIQKEYFSNAIGTLLKSEKNLSDYIKDKLEITNGKDLVLDFSEYCRINQKSKETLFEDFGYSMELIEVIDKYKNSWYLETDDLTNDSDNDGNEVFTGKKYKIGYFNNNEELLGVSGGFEVEVRGIDTLETLKNIARNKGRVIDNVTLGLLEYLNEEKELNRLGIFYSNAKKILDSRDLFIHDYLNNSIVIYLKNIELMERNQGDSIKRNSNLEIMKEKITKGLSFVHNGLEEVLDNSYKKEQYLQDNNLKDNRNRKLDKSVFEKIGLKTKRKSYVFLESFLLEEDKKKNEENKESKENKEKYSKLKKQDEELVATAKDKRLEKEAMERSNYRGGWKISNSDGKGMKISYT